VLWRLVETGVLGRIDRISSVSGGSITAATMALSWERIDVDSPGAVERYRSEVVDRVREIASRTLDVRAAAAGLVTPGQTIGQRLAAQYRRRLFGRVGLSELPERPIFVINATNLGSGALWRFTREYMADWRVGRIKEPKLELAVAVACSSAFPPILSPYHLALAGERWTNDRGNDLGTDDYRHEARLSDGGVYDNLGLETVYKRCRTVLVSDAGREMAPKRSPARDWVRQTFRVTNVVDNQVRTLRKEQLKYAYRHDLRDGAYFGIRSDIEHFGLDRHLDCPRESTLLLADIPTRLKRLDATRQERLVNWGYAICDTALRKHVEDTLEPPEEFPYPGAGVG
jgi:NTE family protein